MKVVILFISKIVTINVRNDVNHSSLTRRLFRQSDLLSKRGSPLSTWRLRFGFPLEMALARLGWPWGTFGGPLGVPGDFGGGLGWLSTAMP